MHWLPMTYCGKMDALEVIQERRFGAIACSPAIRARSALGVRINPVND
jgi:hypothetical protein